MNHAVSQAFWHDEATNNKGSKDQIPFMDHSLVVAKGLCNSVKLWAMPRRATQDRWVIAKSSDKQGPLKEEMAKRSSILAMRTSWTVWKDKKL